MKFDELVKKILENTTTAVITPSTGTVFSGDTVYNPGSTIIAGVIGSGKVIKRSKPELITTPLFKGIKKVTQKKKKK